MVVYNLSDPLKFIGCESGASLMAVFSAPTKDAPNLRDRNFGPVFGVSVGSAASAQYNELRVFNGTIKGRALDTLIQDLRDQKLRVNRDGYCYIRIPGRRNPAGVSLQSRFARLNDLFPWVDYVDEPTKFNPTPPSTIWNRRSSSNTTLKMVDYDKLDADLKQAQMDKKTAEKNKETAEKNYEQAKKDKEKAEKDYEQAKKDKKKAEDDLEKANKEKNEAMDNIRDNWEKATSIGARPLPLNVFVVTSVYPTDARSYEDQNSGGPDLGSTWFGNPNRISAPASSYVDSIRPGSIMVYTKTPRLFDKYFWWVVQYDIPSEGVYGYTIAYHGNALCDATEQLKFRKFSFRNKAGSLFLDRLGLRNCFILKNITPYSTR